MNRKISVLVVDDNEPVRERSKRILETNENIKKVTTAASGLESMALCDQDTPDVILMDIEMEHREAGIEATHAILEKHPDVKVIMHTIYEDNTLVYSAFKEGVVDYLLKNSDPSEVTRAVVDAYYERSSIQPAIATKIRREFQRIKNIEKNYKDYVSLISRLTITEIEILKLVSNGFSRRQICDLRHVELTTIKTQISSMLKKTNCKKTSDLVQILRKMDLLNVL